MSREFLESILNLLKECQQDTYSIDEYFCQEAVVQEIKDEIIVDRWTQLMYTDQGDD